MVRKSVGFQCYKIEIQEDNEVWNFRSMIHNKKVANFLIKNYFYINKLTVLKSSGIVTAEEGVVLLTEDVTEAIWNLLLPLLNFKRYFYFLSENITRSIK